MLGSRLHLNLGREDKYSDPAAPKGFECLASGFGVLANPRENSLSSQLL